MKKNPPAIPSVTHRHTVKQYVVYVQTNETERNTAISYVKMVPRS